MTTYKHPELPPWAVPSAEYDPEDWRSLFQHNVDEIVYKHSFRKLAHKTQVIVQPSDDTFRTRLVHTLEVAQIVDNLCYMLELNRDLGKAIAFGHDLGHPPFAHVGERTLSRLLTDYVQHAAIGLGAPKPLADTIPSYFKFKHSHNSRRILQRKTRGLSDLTLKSVVRHDWSPWKDCSTLSSMDEVRAYLQRPLSEVDSTLLNLLPCYEAQALAAADQIVGLSSDMEDLIHLERSTDHLREAAQELLTRLKLTQSDKMQIKDILDKCITDFAEARGQHRGWGRKYRLSSTISSIIDNSRERLRNCKSFHDAESSPIAPSPHIAIALDLLERASRTILYNDPEIRRRDGVAESATVTMFNEFLNLARRQEAPITMTGTDIFSKSIHDDFYHWLEDYRNEITKETEEDGCISAPAMRQAASPVMDLWRKVQPAVAVVDYISEMTDRFVIHEVFAGHDLQKTLLSTFDGAYLRQMRA